MRNIFFALLLANLAFAAWHAWFSQTRQPVRSADLDAPRITLLRELPEERREAGAAPIEPGALGDSADSPEEAAAAGVDGPSSNEEPVAPVSAEPDLAAAAAATSCSSVGPFSESSQAAAATANLRAAGYEPVQRVAEGDIWVGYWIYIEAIPSETEANDILTKVRAEGIADSYVIPNSESGNLVSVGVFTDIGGVSRRREQLRELGYEATVADRMRQATVYWLDVTLTADQTIDFDMLQTSGRIIRLEQRSCAAVAG